MALTNRFLLNALLSSKISAELSRISTLPLAVTSSRQAHAARNTVINFVPQQEAWVVERMGKFYKILEPGPNFLLPVIDKIKFVQNLRESAIDILEQGAITIDNVHLRLDGVLYFRVFDPYKASYCVDDPKFAVTQLAQTTMCSEVGKINLETVFKKREQLNENVVYAINEASVPWGIQSLYFDYIKMNDHDRISPSEEIWQKLATPYDKFDGGGRMNIGHANEIEHLSPGTFSSPSFPVSGRMHGLDIRYMVPLVCQPARFFDNGMLNSKAANVWFLVDTGSPFTCLTVKTLETFIGTGNVTHAFYEFAIQDQKRMIQCQVSKGHFEFVNILGADAMRQLKLSIVVDWDKKKFKLIQQ